MDTLGIVVIGRNEGERLRRCLASVAGTVGAVVYVDSGSTDGSVAAARALGAEVVALDLAIPFTAARARNAGLARLRALAPAVRHVQFVDGDCEVVDGWLARAAAALEADPGLAVACGRLRERSPGATIYNRLADLEWDTPVGPATACGGIAMMRIVALEQAGGFDPTMIAGEEPELCLRLRRLGWRIERLDAEMALHDIAMTRFGQWWRRGQRAGFAYADGAARHGRGPERHWVREARSNWFWGLLLPAAALGLAWPTGGLSLAALLGYPALAARVARHGRRRGWPPGDAWLYAAHCTLGKFPQALGQFRRGLGRLARRPSRLIEYKGAAPPAVAGAAAAEGPRP